MFRTSKSAAESSPACPAAMIRMSERLEPKVTEIGGCAVIKTAASVAEVRASSTSAQGVN